MILILYANYHPRSQLSTNARYFYENVELRKTNQDFDLIWLEASPQVPSEIQNWKLPKKIIHDKQNLGRDFGIWGRALAQIDLKKYEYVLFLNKSCLGPTQDGWLEIFTEAFQKYPKAAVVGPMANAQAGWHIQTWTFMLKTADLQDLLKNEARAFGNKMRFYPHLVFDSREYVISQYFLKKDRSIVCFLKNYPEIFLNTKTADYPVIAKTDPNYGFFREGLSGSLSARQNLVFFKNTPGK